MSELRLVVPMLPPSAGHYNRYRVAPSRTGKSFVQVYPTDEAKVWWACVAAVNAGRQLRGPSLELQYIVFFPDRRRRDVDNAGRTVQMKVIKKKYIALALLWWISGVTGLLCFASSIGDVRLDDCVFAVAAGAVIGPTPWLVIGAQHFPDPVIIHRISK